MQDRVGWREGALLGVETNDSKGGIPGNCRYPPTDGTSTTINTYGPKTHSVPTCSCLRVPAFARNPGRVVDKGCSRMRLQCNCVCVLTVVITSSVDETRAQLFKTHPINTVMNPSTTALILVGYQNDYFAPRASFGALWRNPTGLIPCSRTRWPSFGRWHRRRCS